MINYEKKPQRPKILGRRIVRVISGFNYKTAIQKTIEADVAQMGSVVLNAKILSDICYNNKSVFINTFYNINKYFSIEEVLKNIDG